jgi:hypothetical protein
MAQATDQICRKKFGNDWRMAEHHDNGGFTILAKGDLKIGQRAWVAINNQKGNCWDSVIAESPVESEEKVSLDPPLTDQQLKILDDLPDSQVPLEQIQIDKGVSATDVLLKNDPCFLVKTKAGSKETLKKAQELCNKK